MTRSIGDDVATSVGVTWKPEIAIYKLSSEDKVVVLGSDGLWDVLSNDVVRRRVTIGCKDSEVQI